MLYDYFAAETDESAAATLDDTDGPRGDPTAYALLGDWSIDPLVHLDNLDEIFTGRPYDPTDDHVVADADGGEQLVLKVREPLVAAIAHTDEATLRQAATQWAQAEEFVGHGDPVMLAEFLIEFADLARRVAPSGHGIYCWLSV